MARKALVNKAQAKPKFKSRIQRRCWRCGRVRGVLRKFGTCRICFVELADQGKIPGIKKASW